jgi:hypothetical protein
MNKEIKKQMRMLKKEKEFLEKVIHWRVNDLNFFSKLNAKDEVIKITNYLDITWRQYAELCERIKALKKDNRGWKLVR